MTVKEFVETYKIAAKPEEFIKKHIVKTYIPYEQKVVIATNIIKTSSYSNELNKNKYNLNSPAQYVLWVTTLISKYTDIEIEIGNLSQFNELDELDLIELIISAIPESEYNKFNSLLSMIRNDLYENERSIQSYLDMFKLSLDELYKLLDKVKE